MAEVRKLGGRLGAEVTGLDLGRPSDEGFSFLHRALLEHLVVAVRGQKLSAEDFVRLARAFGTVEPHVLSQYHHPRYPEIIMLSNVIENGRPKGLADGGSFWHSDYSYKEIPAKETLLHALEIPPSGGDTMFANLCDAYAALPDRLKQRIEGVQALHNYDYRHRQQIATHGVRRELTEEQRRETPDVIHPVVRTHPETGRSSLYINPGFLVGFVGMSEAESDELKEELFSYCLKPELQYAHKWRVGDVVIWDNRCTMHSATGGYRADQHRTLLRCTVLGDRPYQRTG